MNTNPFGHTRSHVGRRHAFITPDTHVTAPLPGWHATPGIIQISPRMGAGFVQYLALMEPGSASEGLEMGTERFIYVLQGKVKITPRGEKAKTIGEGEFVWLPPDQSHRVSDAKAGTRLFIIEKEYIATPGPGPVPAVRFGKVSDFEGVPFQGDPDARLQTLLPLDPEWDMAVNVFTYQPGARLPLVEIHVMEHGLLMIQGEGVYRLEDNWYPTQKGDVIWMAPYCPQWFVAMGKEPAAYIYYKDMNRSPFELM